MSGRFSAKEHRERSEHHFRVGQVLAESKHEWGAVILFYAAFHSVRAAMVDDPIFSDPSALHAAHRLLTPDDRWTTMHKARRGGEPRLGVNEIVGIIYPDYSGPYEKLHVASVQVRYERGLRPLEALSEMIDYARMIREAEASGRLVSEQLPDA